MARTPKSTVAKKSTTTKKQQRSTEAKKQQRSTEAEKQRRAGAKAACCARDKDRYKHVIFPDLYIPDYVDDRCDQCGFEAKTTIAKLRHLVAHIPRDHPAWTVFHRCECVICGKPHATMDQVADHYSRSHRESFNYPCPHKGCTTKKGDRSGIYRHRRRVHNYRTKKEREAEAAAQLDAEVAARWEVETAVRRDAETNGYPPQPIDDCSAPTSSSSTPLATPPPSGFWTSFEAPCERGGELPSFDAAVYGVDAFASFVPDQTMESDFGGVNAHDFDHVAQGFDHVAHGFANVDEFAGPAMGLEFDAFSQLSQPSAHAMAPHPPRATAAPTIPGMATSTIPGMAAPTISGMTPQSAPLPAAAMALGYPATGAPQIARPSRHSQTGSHSQTGIQFSGFEFLNYPDGWTPANIPRPMCFPPVPPPTWTAEAGIIGHASSFEHHTRKQSPNKFNT
uniref:C2H2-type domain-containing protein n=1 Tax=Schizophyllum commune (strain H4-8 / FGSC 9210) TaxID=578458 RepID=D8Q6L0_SCHCM